MQLCPECTGPLFLAPPASRALVGVTPRGGMWFRGSVLATTLGVYSLCDEALRNSAQALWEQQGKQGECDEIKDTHSVDCSLEGMVKTFLPGE